MADLEARTRCLLRKPPPDCDQSTQLVSLFKECVRSYVRINDAESVDWGLVAQASAAMLLLLRRRRPRRRQWVRYLLRQRDVFGEYEHLVRDMRLDDGEDFFQYFRMTKQRFDHLLSLVGPQLEKQTTFWRRPITPGARLALTIRYLAHGSSQRIVGANYRVARSTTSKIIRETCVALCSTLDPLYRPAPTSSEWTSIADEFCRLWNFPNCVGALDGKHVTIQAPLNAGSEFFNYKGTQSIVLLATCDANHRFILVDIGQPGRHSDGGIFRSSDIGQHLLSGGLGLPCPRELPGTFLKLPFVFLGDEAFPLLGNLMRPYPKRGLCLSKRLFNYRLSRARRLIENAFGILVARWRIFRQPIQASYETVTAVVWAAVSLHNYLKSCDVSEQGERRYCPPGYTDKEDGAGEVLQGQWRADAGGECGLTDVTQTASNNYAGSAATVREQYTKYFHSQAGSVPWQMAVVYRGATPAQ